MKKFLSCLSKAFLIFSVSLCLCGEALPQSAVPSVVAFGASPIFTTPATQNTVFTNTTASTLASLTVSVSGGNSGDFSISTNPATNCGGSLTAGSTCTITVTFTPQAAGVRTSTIAFSWTGGSYSATIAGNGLALANNPVFVQFYSDTSVGTSANSLAKFTTSNCPSNITYCVTSEGTSDTAGSIGVVTAGAGKGTLNTIQVNGITNCVADNNITALHYMVLGSSSAGACHDSGAATVPASNEYLGIALASVTSGGGATVPIMLGINRQ